MLATLLIIYKNPIYILITSTVGVVVFSVAIWLPNLVLITTVVTSETASVFEKGMFILSLYGGILTNFTIVSAIYTFVIALLSGLYIAVFVYYLKQQKRGVKSVGTSVTGMGGIISGLFGVGCAACGTFLFTSLLTAGSAGALLAWLPFGGEEFGMLGVGLLVYSIYALLHKINSPKVCKS